MYIRSKKNTGKFINRYPYIATLKIGNGSKNIKLPNQHNFKTKFVAEHGCSLAAACIALQFYGCKWMNPTQIYNYCKRAFKSGYTGSKLTIFGVYRFLKKQVKNGTKYFDWKPFNGDHKTDFQINVKKCIEKGGIVVIERRNPIHTEVILGKGSDGKYRIGTYGKVQSKTLSEITADMLSGRDKDAFQRTWFKESKTGAGYIICNPK